MNDIRRSRWQLGFVAYRWRHLLWVIPAVTLFVMLVLHWEHLCLDRVTAVVYLRPIRISSVSSFAGSSSSSMITSPGVLIAAVRETRLAETWKITDYEGAERLRSLVTCDVIPGTAQLEVRVKKISGADSKAICEAILKHAKDAAAAEQYSKAVEDLNHWKGEAEKTAAEVDGLRAQCVEELGRSGVIGKALADSYNAKQRLLVHIKLKVISDEMNLRVLESPSLTLVAPHWPSRPAAHHVKRFLISAGWALGVSVMLAFVLAYVLEWMIPRRPRAESEP